MILPVGLSLTVIRVFTGTAVRYGHQLRPTPTVIGRAGKPRLSSLPDTINTGMFYRTSIAGDRRRTRGLGLLLQPRRPSLIARRSVSVAADIEPGASSTSGRCRRHRKGKVAALRALSTVEAASTTAGEGASEAKTASSLVASAAVESYLSRKRQVWAVNDGSGRRDVCAGCRRPRNVCLCSSLPPEPLPTAIRFVILQHPAEHKRRITGTVPLILQCLSNCRRMVMHVGGLQPTEDDLHDILGLGSGKDDDTDSAFPSSGAIPLLLFPCAEAEFIEDIASARLADAATTQRSEYGKPNFADAAYPKLGGGETNSAVASSSSWPSSPLSRSSAPNVVVLIDGTWSQAKQILGRYPCLTDKFVVRKPWLLPEEDEISGGSSGAEETSETGVDLQVAVGDGFSSGEFAEQGDTKFFCRAVKFRSAGSSGYGFRKEPSEECISTLESVAYTLEVLERTPDGLAAADHLRRAFSAMMALQLKSRDNSERPRFVDRKKKTANRRLTPPKKDVSRRKVGGSKYTSMRF